MSGAASPAGRRRRKLPDFRRAKHAKKEELFGRKYDFKSADIDRNASRACFSHCAGHLRLHSHLSAESAPVIEFIVFSIISPRSRYFEEPPILIPR